MRGRERIDFRSLPFRYILHMHLRQQFLHDKFPRTSDVLGCTSCDFRFHATLSCDLSRDINIQQPMDTRHCHLSVRFAYMRYSNLHMATIHHSRLHRQSSQDGTCHLRTDTRVQESRIHQHAAQSHKRQDAAISHHDSVPAHMGYTDSRSCHIFDTGSAG